MKVLLIKLAKGFYGGEKQFMEWSEGLQEFGNEVALLTHFNSEFSHRTKASKKYNFNLFPYPDTRPKALWFSLLLPYHWYRGFFILKRIKKEFGCEVMCMQEPYEKIVFTPLARFFKIKVIWLDVLYWKPFLVNNFVLMPWLKFSARFVDLIIASSKFIYGEMKEIFPSNKIIVIRHVLQQKEVDKLKKVIPIAYPIKTIGFIGSLSNAKGVVTLIEAFKLISNEYPDVKLLYAGSGDQEDKLNARIKEYNLENKVLLLGKQPKLGFLNKVSLIVVPSYFDSTPYVLQESMFAKRMVVATNTGGIPALFNSKTNGWLAEPNNISDLSDKMKNVLKLNEKQLEAIINENYSVISEFTNYEKMMKEVVKSFKEVVKRG